MRQIFALPSTNETSASGEESEDSGVSNASSFAAGVDGAADVTESDDDG